MAGMNVGMCCSGLDALKFFEKMYKSYGEKTPETDLMYDRALSRFRYEVAKGYGLPPKLNKGVKAWHKDFYTCAHCGAGMAAGNNYCPNCGTGYLKNDYTEGLLNEQAPEYREWLEYMNKVSGENDDVDKRRHETDEIIRTYRDGIYSDKSEPADGAQGSEDGDSESSSGIPGLCTGDERQVPVGNVLG